MAETVGILGQVAPGTAEQVVATGGPNGTVVSTVFVCNQSGAGTYRLRLARAGDTTAATRQYLFYDTALAANDSHVITAGLTLGPGDILYARGSASTISFNAVGLTR